MTSYGTDIPDNDPVTLCRDMVRCPSITPADCGAQDVIIRALEPLGFAVYDVSFNNIRNTFLRLGKGRPHFAYAGHTDVVPPGDETLWRYPPFSGTIDEEGVLYGRGCADMKSGNAAFIAAVSRYLRQRGEVPGSISLLITGDEEDRAVDGTSRMLVWMKENAHIPDFCLVGEPSNPDKLGETVKIGRRGSLTCRLKIKGKAGHVAYPHRADNPVPRMVSLLAALSEQELDEGSEHFPPSSLQISSVDVGNKAANVIPGEIEAVFNVRFNDCWTGKNLKQYLHDLMKPFLRHNDEISWATDSDSFITKPGIWTDMASDAIEEVLGIRPALKTDGGTSDARFIKNYCPVLEFGMINKYIHQIDERIKLDDLVSLTEIYTRILEKFFLSPQDAAA